MNFAGKLFILEGPDGVGKTTLAKALFERIWESGVDCSLFAFPGNEEGTLGKHVYQIHHIPASFGIKTISPTSIQILHVAAHVEAIETVILPALRSGRCIILDRFWWSTWVYGSVSGVNKRVLRAMIDLELTSWQDFTPAAAFLILRKTSLRLETPATFEKTTGEYLKLSTDEKGKYPIHIIDNNDTIENSISKILDNIGFVKGKRKNAQKLAPRVQEQLSFTDSGVPKREPRGPVIFSKLAPAKPSIVFDTYWRFAVERQAVFFRRANGHQPPWTRDPILLEYKFTNAYRASDRVSQYLIKRVIYEGDQKPSEIFFRILLFKVFNRIETWELLVRKLGGISFKGYSFKAYDSILTAAIDLGARIYSAAYIMPSGGPNSPFKRKHRMHLNLIETMLKDELPMKIADAPNMAKAFDLIRAYPSIGDFLAYQYVTDLNYSVLTDFSEMQFAVPGPGARDGIRKCFTDLGGLNETEIIRMVTDRQDDEFRRLGLQFQSLWGRRLQLIDCQNIFCEVDKYSRVAHPEFSGHTGRNRIKQKFKTNSAPITYWYPPKWGINHLIKNVGSNVSSI